MAMENPYEPPPADSSESSKRTWIATGFGIITAILSILVLVIILNNTMLALSRPTMRPSKVLQWVGVIAMTTVMLSTSIALAHISFGLFRSQAKILKRGLGILLLGVLGYGALVLLAITTSIFK